MYPHNYPGAWVDQQYLPDGLERGVFYQPSERGWEAYRSDAARRDRGLSPIASSPNAAANKGGEGEAKVKANPEPTIETPANTAHAAHVAKK
jgi:putative ATPase